MADTLTRKYQRTEFRQDALKDAYEAMRGLLKGEGWRFNITADYAHQEGFTTRKRLDPTDLSGVNNMDGSPKSLSFECSRDEQSQALVLLQGLPDCLYLVTSAADSAECVALNEVFVQELSLESITEEFSLQGSSLTGTGSTIVRDDPTTLTLGSLCQNMPISGWLCLCGLVLAAFVLGLMIG